MWITSTGYVTLSSLASRLTDQARIGGWSRLPARLGRVVLRYLTEVPVAPDLYPVKPQIRERSHIASLEEYQRLYRLSLDNPEWFWGEQAKAISWYHPWHNVFDADYDEIDFAWY